MSFEKVPDFLVNFFEAESSSDEMPCYRFNSFVLDVAERQLFHDDKAVSLSPKAFDVLVYLVEHSGHLVLKDELMNAVWPDSFVDEGNLPRTIHTLRGILGEDENGGKFIETVPTKGYRFVTKVDEVNEPVSEPPELAGGSIAAKKPPTANIKHPARVVLFTVGFATAIFLFFILSFNFQPTSSVGPNEIKSIAVLPLKPLTTENRDPSYELGIADSLILELSSVRNLIVRPLSATRQYADIEQDPIAAGREQKVDYVLASNYQIADGKIRITSQLINLQSGQVEGSFKVEHENAAIFAVQDAVAANIGKPLLKKLNRESNDLAEKRYTTNEEAYRLYLQGVALADRRTIREVHKAIEYFEQAVRLDPNYALAYARMASALIARDAGKEQYLNAKAAIGKALAIDDNVAEAHSFLGEIKAGFEGDFAGAEREHKRAIELDPNSSVAHRMYSLLLTYVGRHDEAIAEIKTAIDLEPAKVVNHVVFGRSYLFARRYDEAITELERAAEMDPEAFFALQSLSVTYRAKGDYDKAFEYYIKKLIVGKADPDEINSSKTIYARSGWRGIFERDLKDAQKDEKNGKPNYVQLANFSSELGQVDQAFAYLEKALLQDGTIGMLKVHPRFDPLRSDPRYDDLLRRVGLK
jgi:DNA-binding winged helix-turn-helix (wHTH) protein/tetratricopeptide (TPR) repeat protein